MSIQSSINQAINLGGLLYTQTGAYKAKQEEIFKKKEIAKAEEGAKQARQSSLMAQENLDIYPKNSSMYKESLSLAAQSSKKQAEEFEKVFQLDPSSKNLVRATVSKINSRRLSNELYDIEKAREANKKATDRVNAMSEQKQSVQRYMMLLKEDKQ